VTIVFVFVFAGRKMKDHLAVVVLVAVAIVCRDRRSSTSTEANLYQEGSSCPTSQRAHQLTREPNTSTTGLVSVSPIDRICSASLPVNPLLSVPRLLAFKVI
jgi:hypothetical protein